MTITTEALPETVTVPDETREARVTFKMCVTHPGGKKFEVAYDSRSGLSLLGECWNKDLSLFHDMIAACTEFTRKGRYKT